MKIKLEALVNSIKQLNDFIDKNGTIPSKKAFKLAKAIIKINEELKAYYQVRSAKIKEYGEFIKNEKGEDTQDIQVKSENLEKYNTEMNLILNQELDLDIEKITKDDISGSVDIKLLIPLDWLLEF